MSRVRTWWAHHLYLGIGVVLSVSLLAAAAGFAATGNPEQKSDSNTSTKTGRVGSANISLPDEEPSAEPPPGQPAGAQVPDVGFSINCPSTPTIPVQDGDAIPCNVISRGGFSEPVAIKCVNPPKGLDCTPDPSTLTPPPNGSEQFHLALSNNSVKPGKTSFKVVGTSGDLTSSFTYPFNVKGSPGAGADGGGSSAQVFCTYLPTNRIIQGQAASTTCDYQASPEFKGVITTSCSAPPGMTCSVAEPSVAPRYPTPATVVLNLTAAADAPLGPTKAIVRGASTSFNKFEPPLGTLTLIIVAPPAPPAVQLPRPHYSMVCSPPAITVVMMTTAQLPCEIGASILGGPVNVSVASDNSMGPRVWLTGADHVVIAPSGRATVTVNIDASGPPPGSYQYVLTLRHVGPYPPDADPTVSQTVTVDVVGG